MLQPQFASVDDVQQRLGAAGYLTDHAIATTVATSSRRSANISGSLRCGTSRRLLLIATGVQLDHANGSLWGR